MQYPQKLIHQLFFLWKVDKGIISLWQRIIIESNQTIFRQALLAIWLGCFHLEFVLGKRFVLDKCTCESQLQNIKFSVYFSRVFKMHHFSARLFLSCAVYFNFKLRIPVGWNSLDLPVGVTIGTVPLREPDYQSSMSPPQRISMIDRKLRPHLKLVSKRKESHISSFDLIISLCI